MHIFSFRFSLILALFLASFYCINAKDENQQQLKAELFNLTNNYITQGRQHLGNLIDFLKNNWGTLNHTHKMENYAAVSDLNSDIDNKKRNLSNDLDIKKTNSNDSYAESNFTPKNTKYLYVEKYLIRINAVLFLLNYLDTDKQ